MFDVINLSAKRGKRIIFQKLNFHIDEGSITALIGKNGCGKSTFVECVNRILPYSGKILFKGNDISGMSPQKWAKSCSVLPQVLVYPHITVRELILFGRTPYLGISGRINDNDLRICNEAAISAGVEKYLDVFVDKLSGGERQKAYLAMAIAQDTPLLLLDEPTTYTDMAYEKSFMETIASLKSEKKKTFVMIMHNINLAIRYADNVAVLDNGELAFFGKRNDCIASGVIERVFNVEKCIVDGDVFYKA